MFDIGFSELVVIGLVALVVIGPERLPRVARTVGLLLGRAQRYVQDVKMEIHREIQLDELKHLEANMQDSLHALDQSVREEIESAKSVFADVARVTSAEALPSSPPEPPDDAATKTTETAALPTPSEASAAPTTDPQPTSAV
jgi:sec-independent protein translocase protein TatB